MNVDPEFSAFMTPLSDDEVGQLEANLITDGCREPLTAWRGLLLDGHHRFEICERLGLAYQTIEVALDDRPAALLWIARNQAGRRNLSVYQRCQLALKAEPALKAAGLERMVEGGRTGAAIAGRGRPKEPDRGEPISAHPYREPQTRDELAALAGCGHDTLAKTRVIEEQADERLKTAVNAGKVTINAAHKTVVKTERAAKKKVAKAETIEAADVEGIDVRHCSMQELLGGMDGELDAIITDPPYAKEYTSIYGELAKLAHKALKPEGILAVMCGQSYLPDLLAIMTPHIEYRWTMAYMLPGQSGKLWQRRINNSWKPILLFGGSSHWSGDVVSSDADDKQHHHWGQSESGMSRLVETLTDPGVLVCDPFCGGGTTGVVSVASGRRFVGADVEEKSVMTTKSRIAEIIHGTQ